MVLCILNIHGDKFWSLVAGLSLEKKIGENVIYLYFNTSITQVACQPVEGAILSTAGVMNTAQVNIVI